MKVVRRCLWLLAFVFFWGCGEGWIPVPDGQRDPAPARHEWKLVEGAPKAVWSEDGETIWLAGVGGLVLCSTDGGDTWTEHDTGSDAYLSSIVVRGDGEVVWAGGEALLQGIRQADGGYTWTERPLPASTRFLLALFVSRDGKQLWAGLADEGEYHVYRSDDSGGNWRKVLADVFDFDVVETEDEGPGVWVVQPFEDAQRVGFARNPDSAADFQWRALDTVPKPRPQWMIKAVDESTAQVLNAVFAYSAAGFFRDPAVDRPRLFKVSLESDSGSIGISQLSGVPYVANLAAAFPVVSEGSGAWFTPILGGRSYSLLHLGSDSGEAVYEAWGPQGRLQPFDGWVRAVVEISGSEEILALDSSGNLGRCSRSSCRWLRFSAGSMMSILPPVEADATLVGLGRDGVVERQAAGWLKVADGEEASLPLVSASGRGQALVLKNREVLIRAPGQPTWRTLPSVPRSEPPEQSTGSNFHLVDIVPDAVLLRETVTDTGGSGSDLEYFAASSRGKLWMYREPEGWTLLDLPDPESLVGVVLLKGRGPLLLMWDDYSETHIAREWKGEEFRNVDIAWIRPRDVSLRQGELECRSDAFGSRIICSSPADKGWYYLDAGRRPMVGSPGVWWDEDCDAVSVDAGRHWNPTAYRYDGDVSRFPFGSRVRVLPRSYWDEAGSGVTCALDPAGRLWIAAQREGVYVSERTQTYPQVEAYRFRHGAGGSAEGHLELKVVGGEGIDGEQIQVEVLGANGTDIDNQRNLLPLDARDGAWEGSASASRIWRAGIDPTENPIDARAGTTEVHLEVVLATRVEGEEFIQAFSLPAFTYDPWHWARDLKRKALANILWLVPLLLWAGFVLFLVVLLFRRPLAIPRLHHGVRKYRLLDSLQDVPLLGPILQAVLGATLLPYLARHPRTLDAWVDTHGEVLARKFRREASDLSEGSYVPLPVRCHEAETGRLVSRPSAGDFREAFRRERSVVAILGPGGAGKTSLALEIGRWARAGELTPHPMAPILIDEETQDVEAVLRRKLRSWLGEELDGDFLKALLARKRLLLVFDHLSEMSDAMRKHVAEIHGGKGALPVDAMVITARFPIPIEGAEAVEIHPQPLNPENLLYFITHQLQERDAQDVFGDFDDQLGLAGNIARVVRLGKEKVPILPIVVSLYIREAVAQLRSSGGGLDDLPKSVPEVYFQFLRRVNPSDDVPNRMSDEDMLRAAERLATLSLSKSFEPEQEFLASEARKALAAAGWNEPEKLDPAQRLVDNGILAARERGADTFYSFVLDPLLEVLAAMAMARDCGQDRQQWAAVLSAVADAGRSAEGFRFALYFVHDAYARDYGWPDLLDEGEETPPPSE